MAPPFPVVDAQGGSLPRTFSPDKSQSLTLSSNAKQTERLNRAMFVSSSCGSLQPACQPLALKPKSPLSAPRNRSSRQGPTHQCNLGNADLLDPSRRWSNPPFGSSCRGPGRFTRCGVRTYHAARGARWGLGLVRVFGGQTGADDSRTAVQTKAPSLNSMNSFKVTSADNGYGYGQAQEVAEHSHNRK